MGPATIGPKFFTAGLSGSAFCAHAMSCAAASQSRRRWLAFARRTRASTLSPAAIHSVKWLRASAHCPRSPWATAVAPGANLVPLLIQG